MTEQEYKILSNRIVSMLKSMSKTIAELPIEQTLTGDDLVEISGGRSAKLSSLVKLFGSGEFLSRVSDDSAEGLIRFLRGLAVGNGSLGIDANGDAVLRNLRLQQNITAEGFRTPDFTDDDLAGAGFGVVREGDLTKLVVDKLLVRRIATFLKLEIRELAYVAGNIVLSAAASEISEVEEVRNAQGNLTGWRCSWCADDGSTATTNTWMVGDQARCQTFNIAPGVHDNVGNHYYWRLVTEVGADYVVLSATDSDTATDNSNAACIPHVGDKIVQMGYRLGANANANDPDDAANRQRTTLLMLATSGDDAPSIKGYANITNYALSEDKQMFMISPAGVSFNSEYFSWTYGGVHYPQRIHRGDWFPGANVTYYSEWEHNGCTWLCVNPSGSTAEPSMDSPDWRLIAGTPGTLARFIRFTSEYGDFDRGIYFGERVKFKAWVSDALLNDHSDDYEGWTITRNTGNETSDALWNISRADIDDNGIFHIEWSAAHDDLQAEHATFKVTAFRKGQVGQPISQSFII